MAGKKLEKTRRKFGKKILKLDMSIQKNCSYFNNMYGNSRTAFGLCSTIKNGKIRLLTNVTTCRESLAYYVLEIVKGNTTKEKLDALPTNRTCVVICVANVDDRTERVVKNKPVFTAAENKLHSYNYEDWMLKSCEAGLSLVNHFERRNKWLTTKMYKVDYDMDTKRFIMYYFTGSKMWIQTPHTFSLFNLLIRLGRYDIIQGLHKNSSFETVMAALYKLSNISSASDSNRIKNYEKWPKVLDNYKIIYKGRTKPFSNWLNNVNRYDGITSLLSGHCRDKIVQERYNKLK